MDKLFKLKENGTDVRTEVLAGLTTFFAMSYILFVNPQILSQTGMPAQGCIPRNDYRCSCGYPDDGLLRQLAICSSARYGTQCLLYLYSCIWAWLFMARSPSYGLYLWNYLIDYYLDKCS